MFLHVRTWTTSGLYSSAFKNWGYARKTIQTVTFLSLCLKNDVLKFIIAERISLEAFLAPWRSPDSEGHKRATFGKNGFTIKWVGSLLL